MRLLSATSPDPQNPERVGIVVEPHPGAPKRAFAQLSEGSDWHEMTAAGALSGGVFPTRKGVGQKLENLCLAWKMGRQHETQAQQGQAPMAHQQGASLMLVLGALLRGGQPGPNQAQPGPVIGVLLPDPAPLVPEADPFDLDVEAAGALSWDQLDAELSAPLSEPEPEPEPKQLPPAEPGIDANDVKKDCDEFDQSLADLSAHLDEARYRAGGL